MSGKPIIFTGESVRAILDGTKTQSRRVVKPQPPDGFRQWGRCINGNAAFTDHPLQGEKGTVINVKGVYGDVGDKLWVRETYIIEHFPSAPDRPLVHYRADNTAAGSGWTAARMWKTPLFMPRTASRLTLEIVGVRVERLHQMTLKDWIADFAPSWQEQKAARASFTGAQFQVDHMRKHWNAINAKRGYPFDSNCWVWVVEFRMVEK